MTTHTPVSSFPFSRARTRLRGSVSRGNLSELTLVPGDGDLWSRLLLLADHPRRCVTPRMESRAAANNRDGIGGKRLCRRSVGRRESRLLCLSQSIGHSCGSARVQSHETPQQPGNSARSLRARDDFSGLLSASASNFHARIGVNKIPYFAAARSSVVHVRSIIGSYKRGTSGYAQITGITVQRALESVFFSLLRIFYRNIRNANRAVFHVSILLTKEFRPFVRCEIVMFVPLNHISQCKRSIHKSSHC